MRFNEELRKTMGIRMRNAREEKGLTQEQVAEISDSDDKHIGKVERGEKTPLISTMYGFWKATDIDMNQLFHELQELENQLEKQQSLEEEDLE
ncbi:helix-turn-helix domain-containing protein [Oceanobacillus sp. 1P07AA]|uniref:helix-turn-helix domain-containing protein n=1 Tax=Oceanobacillus sp. 1P07AA TaxID=3132293 RepID=UPI0039A57C49